MISRAWLHWLLGALFAIGVCAHRAGAQTGTVGVHFNGVTLANGIALNGIDPNVGYAPPDNDGAVGPNNIVQLINGAYAVYDKSGHLEQMISGRQFWINAGVTPGNDGSSLASTLGAFNARVIYDPSSGRWFAAELSGETVNNSVMLARSDTSNPLGPWHAVSFLGNAGGSGQFVDFTRLGIDANGVYVSTNNFTDNTPDGNFDSVSLFSVPKADLLAATPSLVNMTRFDALDISTTGISMQPVVNFNPVSAGETVLGTSGSINDSLLPRTALTGTAGPNATLTQLFPVGVNPYTNPPPAAQPDGTRTLSTVDDRLTATTYQVGHFIYAAQATNANNNAAIDWFKIDANTGQAVQQGTISSPNYDFFQPSIAVNSNGNVVLVFSQSGFGADGNVSTFAVVGRTDANGVITFGTPFLLQASLVDDYHYHSGRWGDYTTTVVDPTDPNVFWTFQQYATASDAWGTQVFEIMVPEPASVVMAAMALAALAIAAWRHRRRAAPILTDR